MLDRIEEDRVVPAVVVESALSAAPLAVAPAIGGLRCAEIAFRAAATPAEISGRHLAFCLPALAVPLAHASAHHDR